MPETPEQKNIRLRQSLADVQAHNLTLIHEIERLRSALAERTAEVARLSRPERP
jgi:hypothetical protein